ncbi:MAG: ArsR family transcriptional regulator [Methylophilaceae bacterium]
MNAILEYLNKHGESLDVEIAGAIKIPLAEVRSTIQQLAEKGAVMSCKVTKFPQGKKVEGISARISGFIPQPSPGRKPKSMAA